MQTTRPVTKPSKQRKMLYNAPAHIRHRLFSAPLAKELRDSQGINSLPVRSGDTVRIMRGDHKGFEGKVSRIETSRYRIFVEGLTREKVDGTTVFVAVHPSKVALTKLNLDDKWRKKVVERKKGRAKPEEIALEKPAKKRRAKKLPKAEEIKAVAVEEEVAPPKKAEETEPAEVKPAEEKPVAAEKPKQPQKRAPRAPRKPKTEKAKEKPETAESKKPRTSRRKTRAKAAKPETEGGT